MPRTTSRRAEILDTFIRQVAERGYDQTSLDDIANEIGMSKSTIIHHFGAKAQLMREVEETYMRRQIDALQLMWSRLETPPERIAAVIYTSALLHRLERDSTVATQREIVQLANDPAMKDVRKLRRKVERLTQVEIQGGVDSGVFRKIDAESATMQLWGFLQWMWVWFDPRGRRTPEKVAADFVDVFLGGLLVDRFWLDRLTDPRGTVVTVAQESLEAVSGSPHR